MKRYIYIVILAHVLLLTGFVAHAPNPSRNTRRVRRVREYAHNETYDPLYTHPKYVPDDIPWEYKITKLNVEEMRKHYVRLQGELKSSTISDGYQKSLHIVLYNLNSLIESYVGVGPSTHIFYDMMHRRRMEVMGFHKFEEIKNNVTKEMVFSYLTCVPKTKNI